MFVLQLLAIFLHHSPMHDNARKWQVQKFFYCYIIVAMDYYKSVALMVKIFNLSQILEI